MFLHARPGVVVLTSWKALRCSLGGAVCKFFWYALTGDDSVSADPLLEPFLDSAF